MSEYERIRAMRLEWAPKERSRGNPTPVETALPLLALSMYAVVVDGVYYQRCGGGRRVIRKRIR